MAETVKDGGPAFAYGNHEQGGHSGMSLRDWLAGQALPAVIRQCAGDLQIMASMNWEGTIEEYFAHRSYALADAMLAERSK